jgi:hypothetical protein
LLRREQLLRLPLNFRMKRLEAPTAVVNRRPAKRLEGFLSDFSRAPLMGFFGNGVESYYLDTFPINPPPSFYRIRAEFP